MSLRDHFRQQARQQLAAPGVVPLQARPFPLVGSDKPVKVEDWLRKLLTVLDEEKEIVPTGPAATAYRSLRRAAPSDRPLVSIITSLYKGRPYIHFFLDHLTRQTIFRDDCELIIVNAASPDGEERVIWEYQQHFDNIRLINLPSRVGLYEAWNLAIEHSTGEFLTNANVDDVRRRDGLEVQAACLLNHLEAEVVYSDVYYAFLPNLPFELAAKCNLRTHLPTANKFNLLRCNSPHNAPMWRRTLHEKIGNFDTSYRSTGDADFWLRAALEGARFRKIDDVLVSYFCNPAGLSTRTDSAGVSEGRQVYDFYRGLYSARFFGAVAESGEVPRIPPDMFFTRVKAYETDFTVTDTHVFYGPYIRLPRGACRAIFHFSLENLGAQRIASPISFDVAQAQRLLCSRSLDEGQRDELAAGQVELCFVNVAPEEEIELRVHTAGRPFQGSLKFHGVGIAMAPKA